MRVKIGQLEVIVDSIEELDQLVKRYGLPEENLDQMLATGQLVRRNAVPIPNGQSVRSFILETRPSLPSEDESSMPECHLSADPLQGGPLIANDPAAANKPASVGWFVIRDGKRIRRGIEVDELGVNRALYTATGACVRAEAMGDKVVDRFTANAVGESLGTWEYDQGAVNNFRKEQDNPPQPVGKEQVTVKYNGPPGNA